MNEQEKLAAGLTRAATGLEEAWGSAAYAAPSEKMAVFRDKLARYAPAGETDPVGAVAALMADGAQAIAQLAEEKEAGR